MILYLFFLIGYVICETYFVSENGGKSKCQIENRCSLQHGVSLINFNKDITPTIDMSSGEYIITESLSIFPCTDFGIISSGIGKTTISFRKKPENETNSLFQISGTPTLTISGIDFYNISDIDCLFDGLNTTSVNLVIKETHFESVSVKKTLISNVKFFGGISLEKVTMKDSSPIIKFTNTDSELFDSDINISIKSSSFFGLSTGIIEFYDSKNTIKFSLFNSFFTDISKITPFIFESPNMGMSVTYSNFTKNSINILSTEKKTTNIILSNNRVTENNNNDGDSSIAFFNFELDSGSSYSIESTSNLWTNNQVGIISIKVNPTENQKIKYEGTNIASFKDDFFSFNHLTSKLGLITILDSRTDFTTQISMSNLQMNNNDVSTNSEGTITFDISGSVVIDIIGGEYDNNIASNGGAISFVSYEASLDSTIRISGSKFRNNNVSGNGGALNFVRTVSSLQIDITDSKFENNLALNGGSMFFQSVRHHNDPKFNMSRTSITRNNAKQFGGGILLFFDGKTCSECFLFITTTTKNQFNEISRNTGGQGGGIYFMKTCPNEYNKKEIYNNTAMFDEGPNILTSPQTIRKKNSKDEKIEMDCSQQEEDGITCTSIEDKNIMTLEFIDKYGQILKKRTFADFEVFLKFSDLKTEIKVSDTKSPLKFKFDEVVTGHNSYTGKNDGEIILYGRHYPVNLEFGGGKKSFFQKYHVYIIIGILVILFLFVSLLMFFGCLCVCVIFVSACSNAPFIISSSKRPKRKIYEVIESEQDY